MAEEMKRQGELTLAGTAQYFFDEAALSSSM